MYTHVDTHSHRSVLQEVIDDFRKGLLGRGSPVWVRPHPHIQAWAPSACTHKSHTLVSPPPNTHTGIHSYTHFDMWYYSSHAVYYIMSFLCCQTAAVWVRKAGRGGARSQGVRSESGTPAQCALYSFRALCAIVGQHGAVFDSSHYNK